MTQTVKKILVDYVFPPIPNRSFDYIAYFDGEEEGYTGNGSTAIDAILALIDKCDPESLYE